MKKLLNDKRYIFNISCTYGHIMLWQGLKESV